MPLINNLSGQLWRLFISSPSQVQSDTVDDENSHNDRHSMSPLARVWNWHTETPSSSSPVMPPLTSNMKRKATTNATSPPKKRRISNNYSNGQDSAYSDTSSPAPSYASSDSHDWATQPRRKRLSQHAANNDDSTITVTADPEDITPTVDIAAEVATRSKQIADLREQHWPERNLDIKRALLMRGFEPLLPNHWAMDFRTIPLELFTSDDLRTRINALSDKSSAHFRATHALQSLMDIGARVRDRVAAGLPPERLLQTAIAAYNKWCLVDAGLWHAPTGFLPVLRIMTAGRKVSTTRLQEGIVRRLEKLATRWETALARTKNTPLPPAYQLPSRPTCPPLYGIIISHTVVALVAYAPDLAQSDAPTTDNDKDNDNGSEDPATPQFRTLDILNFSAKAYDVWHALGLALLLVHCREIALRASQLYDDGHTGHTQGIGLGLVSGVDGLVTGKGTALRDFRGIGRVKGRRIRSSAGDVRLSAEVGEKEKNGVDVEEIEVEDVDA